MAVNTKGNRLDDGGNVAVDYVWGNFPIQPDDERATIATVPQIGGGSGDYGWSPTTMVAATNLDPDLDNHTIATDGRFGFPDFTPDYIGDSDDVANVVVPNIVGLTEAAAQAAIIAAGLSGAATYDVENATLENDGTVASQNPVAGTNVNYGTTIAHVVYQLA